jgi:hypothetical protein
VRLSLGDNSELGGKVTGGYVRWNFFTDPTVTVGTTIGSGTASSSTELTCLGKVPKSGG